MPLSQTNQINTQLLKIYRFLRANWKKLPRSVPSETTTLINIIIDQGLLNSEIDLDPKSGPTTQGISILFFLLQRYYADFYSIFQQKANACVIDIGTGFEVLPLLALTQLFQETSKPFQVIVFEKSRQARDFLQQQITMLNLPEPTIFPELSNSTITAVQLHLRTKLAAQTPIAITATHIEVYPHQQTDIGTIQGPANHRTQLEPLPLTLLQLARGIHETTGILPALTLRASTPQEASDLRALLTQQSIPNLTLNSCSLPSESEINTIPYSTEYITKMTQKNLQFFLYLLSHVRHQRENLVRASF